MFAQNTLNYPVPARTGQPNGYRNRSNEVRGAAQPPRHHSAEKQLAIRMEINKLLELGVIAESQASKWGQAHLVPKGDCQWRLTLDFVQLNAATKGLEGWSIPNIVETITHMHSETHMLRSPRLHSRVSSDSRVASTHRLQGSW